MSSFKNLFLALACLSLSHFEIAAALPADSTVSALPPTFPSTLPSVLSSAFPSGIPTAFTAAPSGTGSPRDLDHKDGLPGFAPGAHNQTHNSFAKNDNSTTTADHCPDMPGNHTRHGVDGHDHHNRTAGKPVDTGTPTGSFLSLITPPPDSTALVAAKGVKFVQTTYYSCVTIGPDSHCGWHEPILDASVDSAGARCNFGGKAWLVGVLMAAMLLY